MTKSNEAKAQPKKQQKCASIRISRETQKKLDCILVLVNKKTIGRKIRPDQLLSLAIELVVEEHVKILQEQSMTNEDRMEVLRRRYSELHGPMSKDAFLGVMLSPEFQTFLSEQSRTNIGITSHPVSVAHAG